MADQRNSFRPRRLAFGGRPLPHASICAAWLALGLAFTPAFAQDAGLRNGAASLAAGKYDAAVRQLSATINSENASQSDAAQALYLRGIAYRKMGEPARAVADLGAAIWLGLPSTDRVKALVNRGLAYQAAGLSKEGAAEIAAARKIGGSREVDQLISEGGGAPPSAAAIAAFATEVRPEGGSASSTSVSSAPAPAPQTEPQPTRTATASPGSWSTSVSDESRPAATSGGNRLTRWFGSLTDSSGSQPAPAPQPAAAPAPAPAAQPSRPAPQPTNAQAPTTGWSTTTETQEASAGASGGESTSRWSRLFNRTAGAEPQLQPAAAPATGAYKLQLATSRSEAEAKGLWKRVSQSQSLPGIQPQIERVEIGDFGTFYALRIGPFPDKAESLKVCNALKRSGIDCSPAE